jgi:hypothetical protein
MSVTHPQRRHPYRRLAYGAAGVLVVALSASLGYAGWEYATWRNGMIEWDRGTIERLCGGENDERLLEIRFVREWEYLALKRMPDGQQVWLHWKLSKRHCGNWTLADPSQYASIRPFSVRFPQGAPPRNAVDCLGEPIDENESYSWLDELQRERHARLAQSRRPE